MSETIGERPIDGNIEPGAVPRDLDSVTLPEEAQAPDIPGPSADTALESAMATGEDAGTPGERAPLDPQDRMGLAAEDDSPLPEGEPGASSGGPQGDGLEGTFVEPPD